MDDISGLIKDPRRIIELKGAYNVRDLGGYPAAGGRRVKWGLLFRAGDLNELTEGDLKKLGSLGLKTFIDFRDDAEVSEAPDKRPATVTEFIRLPIVIGSMKEVIDSGETPDGQVVMPWINQRMAADFTAEFGRFLALAADGSKAPLLFHCTAGKDRTGMAAALILSALGVDWPIIEADYLMSTECVREKYAPLVARRPYMEDLVRVRPEYLAAALKVIDERFGGMEKYLADELKADIAGLRRLYTE